MPLEALPRREEGLAEPRSAAGCEGWGVGRLGQTLARRTICLPQPVVRVETDKASGLMKEGLRQWLAHNQYGAVRLERVRDAGAVSLAEGADVCHEPLNRTERERPQQSAKWRWTMLNM